MGRGPGTRGRQDVERGWGVGVQAGSGWVEVKGGRGVGVCACV